MVSIDLDVPRTRCPGRPGSSVCSSTRPGRNVFAPSLTSMCREPTSARQPTSSDRPSRTSNETRRAPRRAGPLRVRASACGGLREGQPTTAPTPPPRAPRAPVASPKPSTPTTTRRRPRSGRATATRPTGRPPTCWRARAACPTRRRASTRWRRTRRASTRPRRPTARPCCASNTATRTAAGMTWRTSSSLPCARRGARRGQAPRRARRRGGDGAAFTELAALSRDLDKTDLARSWRSSPPSTSRHAGRGGRARCIPPHRRSLALPHGAFFDDALWHASLLDEKLGRVKAAVDDLERLVDKRETTSIMGSYERARYVPSMLRLGTSTATHSTTRESARHISRLYTDYANSTKRADGLWREAAIWREDGDAKTRATACPRWCTSSGQPLRPVRDVDLRGLERPSKSGAPKECRDYIRNGRTGEKTRTLRPLRLFAFLFFLFFFLVVVLVESSSSSKSSSSKSVAAPSSSSASAAARFSNLSRRPHRPAECR